jgi:hypothetical protein
MILDAIHDEHPLAPRLFRHRIRNADTVIPYAIDGQTTVAVCEARAGLKQPKVQFVLLTTWQSDTPAANTFDRQFIPKRAASLWQIPMCQ